MDGAPEVFGWPGYNSSCPLVSKDVDTTQLQAPMMREVNTAGLAFGGQGQTSGLLEGPPMPLPAIARCL